MYSEYDIQRLERVKASPQQLNLRKLSAPPAVAVPLLLVAFGAVFLIAFKLSSSLQQSPWNIPITLGLFAIAVCFMCIDIVAQLNTEVRTWLRWKSQYGLGRWSDDVLPFNGFGLVKFCPPCDWQGIYYTAHHSVRWINFILQMTCRPVLIPWSEIRSVNWADSTITIDLSNGEQLSSGPSSQLFDAAEKHMPPGTVTYEEAGD